MSNPVQKVSAYLTGSSLEHTSYDALKKLADEHPYFGVVQFLLAKKMKEENSEDYSQQSQKTALYFSDYYLLDSNLSQPLEPWNEQLVKAPEHTPEHTFETADTAKQDISQVEKEVAVIARESDETAKAFANEITNKHIIASEAKQSGGNIEAAVESENIPASEPDEHEKMFQNIKAMLDANAEEANADVKNAPLPIDPYYTIDYFASQGIRLDLDPNPSDELGKHLKKFTQWLKHMKKLGPEDAMESMVSAESEAKIQRIADSSNTAKQVVTEAMATVLEKQGKIEKAIELYNKLSFLNPDKSPYFAARIQSLKEHK